MQAITVITHLKKKNPHEQGVARCSESKQPHVGFSISILGHVLSGCMACKSKPSFLHIFCPTLVKILKG